MIDYLRCDDTTHDYGRPDVCLTCFEAHVREDERRNVLVKDGSPGWRFQQTGYRAGYTAALRDAVETVNAAAIGSNNWDRMIGISAALAAIEELRGNQ